MDNYSWFELIKMTKFKEQLKSLRELRDMTQVRLAKLLEVDPKVYNRWERGLVIPKFESMVKLADVLQVTLDELVGRVDISNDIKIHNLELHQLCQQADHLPDTDQQVLIQVIDSLVKRSNISRMMVNTAKAN